MTYQKIRIGLNLFEERVFLEDILKGREIIIIDSTQEHRNFAELLGGTIKDDIIIFNKNKKPSDI